MENTKNSDRFGGLKDTVKIVSVCLGLMTISAGALYAAAGNGFVELGSTALRLKESHTQQVELSTKAQGALQKAYEAWQAQRGVTCEQAKSTARTGLTLHYHDIASSPLSAEQVEKYKNVESSWDCSGK